MIVEGKAVVLAEANVNTDVLYPGQFLNIDDPELMRPHLFEGIDPALRAELDGDTILVVGENFGVGSSREHVPQAMKASGIQALLGTSFARIFYRNCLNLGLPALSSPGAVALAKPGAHVRIDTGTGEVTVDGAVAHASPLPPFMAEMIAAGGLIPYVRRSA